MPPVVLLTPLALAAFAALPLLLWLLRLTPPAPRRLDFPAVRLLLGLSADQDQPARTPWWVLLLRAVTLTLIILGVAHPVIGSDPAAGRRGTLVLAIDNGWASASDWEARQTTLRTLLEHAERAENTVVLVATAPPADGSPVTASQPMPASMARAAVQSIKPVPWPVDRTAAAAALDKIRLKDRGRAVWLCDGLEDGTVTGLATALQRFGSLEVVLATGEPVRLLLPPKLLGDDLTVTVRRPLSPDKSVAPPSVAWVRAIDEGGHVLARESVTLAGNAAVATAHLNLPTELRNRLGRIDLEGAGSSGSVVLLDERWRRHPVGLVAGNPLKADLPLLSDLFYLERALTPMAEVRRGEANELLQRELTLLVLADVGHLASGDSGKIAAWVNDGGVLVRFAGPNLAAADTDPLLPVRLRRGERSIGGAMSWERPLALAPFPPESPFSGLNIPADVRVSTQVLAEPAPDLAAKTWSRLVDGTPLVTASRLGQGWVVLVHTTANTEWSNLAISGLFVDMLDRLLTLGQGVSGEEGNPPLPPFQIMDGFGRLTSPPGSVSPIAAAAFATTRAGPHHPPGFYGTARARRALNLSAGIPALRSITALPSGVSRHGFADLAREIDLKPGLLTAALVLACLDLLLALHLRGMLRWHRTAGLVLLLILAVSPAYAGSDSDAALETRLAYIRTGDTGVDTISRRGLAALTRVLVERTAVVLGEP
ncbi:MAG: BatA domain-containing protein, partial [Alphaproteobacteria bacterium]|nr:BatA domain-containing protein [Alphaproteobacteria bacterium]